MAAATLLVGFAVVAVGIAGGRSAPSAAVRLEAGPAPWAPELRGLDRRLAALRLPGQSDTAFHIHALLRIFVDGRPVPVPAQIGIDPAGRFLAPLHTHDASGILHIESDRPFPFTLGEFFRIWGVRFSATAIGGYVDRGRRRVRVFANGRLLADPVPHVLRAHDRIVVTYGRPGSAPVVDRTPFPPGL